jgi:Lon protease-like protein
MNTDPNKIALFPLPLVLFPGGLLPLKIFEKRYVDMVRTCLREKAVFGIVSVCKKNNDSFYPFSMVGTLVEMIDTDVSQPGIFNIKCLGIQKFKTKNATQQADGLWVGDVELISPENELEVPEDLAPTKVYFEQLLSSLAGEDVQANDMPFQMPFRLESCVWLSSRWCEILDMPLIEKQRMLELDDALLRLTLINDMLTTTINK